MGISQFTDLFKLMAGSEKYEGISICILSKFVISLYFQDMFLIFNASPSIIIINGKILKIFHAHQKVPLGS